MLEALRTELARTDGVVIGMSSAASGGDILSHEACAELGIKTILLLPLPADRFRSESVSPAGAGWEKRFDALLKGRGAPPCLATSDQLPTWLSGRQNYNSWQRANLWLLQEALTVGAESVSLLALWDGTKGDGPGGTEHMIRIAKDNNAATIILSTPKIFGFQQDATASAGGAGGG
jgi:hypothetical protein